jgi:hypothetical protein
LEGGYPAETKIHTTISSLKNYDIYWISPLGGAWCFIAMFTKASHLACIWIVANL